MDDVKRDRRQTNDKAIRISEGLDANVFRIIFGGDDFDMKESFYDWRGRISSEYGCRVAGEECSNQDLGCCCRSQYPFPCLQRWNDRDVAVGRQVQK